MLLLCAFAVALKAQPDDPKELLERVRDKLKETIAGLPKYMCTLTVDRVQDDTGLAHRASSCDDLVARRDSARLHLIVSDRLRLDVAIAEGNEIYSWVGEDRFDDRDLFQLVREGPLQTGGFATFLKAIFEGTAATFTYNGDTTANGQTLAEFGFEAPKEKSGYVFGNRRVDAIVGFGGTFLADAQSFDLVQLTIRARDLPAAVGACEATTTLDYSRVLLNDSSFLLPSEAKLDIINRDGSEAHNRTVYSACHEFLGESTVSFGEPLTVTAAPGASAQSPATFQIPANLPFKVTFTQAIDTAVAAAGDKITGKLSTPIRDAASNTILAPEGSPVTARILKLEHDAGSPPTLSMTVKLETLTLAGTVRSFTASMSSGAKRFEKQPGLTRQVELGSLGPAADKGSGVIEFRNAQENYVIKSGLQTAWTTLGP